MEKDINYKPAIRQVKSVPMFPKGIQRFPDFGDVDSINDVIKDTPIEDIDPNKEKDKDKTDIDPNPNPNPNPNPDPNPDPVTIDFTKNYTVDEEGLKDEEGKVIKSFEDLEKEGYLDENGNVIDPTSKEIKIQSTIEELTLIQEVIKKSGYELKDDKGQVIQYEDTPEGLLQYSIDLGNYLGNKIAQEKQDEFLNNIPEVKAYANHMLKGGTRESYFTYAPKNYTSIDFSKLDTEQRANLIYDDYILGGMNETRARSLVELHKKENQIDGLAEDSFNNLKKKQLDRELNDAKEVQDRLQKEEIENKAYWDGVTTKVKTGKIGDINIPKAEIDNFMTYISAPVDKNGRTAHDVDASKETIDYALQLAYWRYKGYNFKSLVNTLVNKTKVETLRERMNKDRTNKGEGGKNNIREENPRIDFNSINLDTIK